MRPVDRGDAPPDAEGIAATFERPEDMKPHLEARLGPYCSYCERRVSVSLAVEHKQPKGSWPGGTLDWGNVLLGCANCNSSRPKHPINLDDYYWPDRDNTARAFAYVADGSIAIHPQLSADQAARAQSTLELTGLDRRPGHARLSPLDKRWLDRFEVRRIAEGSLEDVRRHATEEQRRKVVRQALFCGLWSVWMTVFRDDRDMLRRLIEAFPGIAKDCFDEQCRPVPRPGGAL